MQGQLSGPIKGTIDLHTPGICSQYFCELPGNHLFVNRILMCFYTDKK